MEFPSAIGSPQQMQMRQLVTVASAAGLRVLTGIRSAGSIARSLSGLIRATFKESSLLFMWQSSHGHMDNGCPSEKFFHPRLITSGHSQLKLL
jgi:hypothetical protein